MWRGWGETRLRPRVRRRPQRESGFASNGVFVSRSNGAFLLRPSNGRTIHGRRRTMRPPGWIGKRGSIGSPTPIARSNPSRWSRTTSAPAKRWTCSNTHARRAAARAWPAAWRAWVLEQIHARHACRARRVSVPVASGLVRGASPQRSIGEEDSAQSVIVGGGGGAARIGGVGGIVGRDGIPGTGCRNCSDTKSLPSVRRPSIGEDCVAETAEPVFAISKGLVVLVGSRRRCLDIFQRGWSYSLGVAFLTIFQRNPSYSLGVARSRSPGPQYQYNCKIAGSF